MNLLSVNRLTHGFAGRTLFQNLNFGLSEGDRVGLIGPNGAGKSTLIKILAQRLSADEGEVVQRRGLKIGILDQDPQFKPGQSIFEALIDRPDFQDEYYGKAFELLARLELNQFPDETKAEELSGGWKKRLALARELIHEPELLILDEPTNHLDIRSILWLEDFLKNERLSVMMVTHDRLFLQRVATRILDLDRRYQGGLLDIKGDYTAYLEARDQTLAGQQQRERALKNDLRRETEWLRRGAIARQTKQQARIQSAAQLKSDVENLSDRNRKRVSEIEFGESERSPQKLIRAEHISQGFEGRVLFENLDLLVNPKTRLALLGENGSGKSTLLRTLLGEIPPLSGKVDSAENLKVAYFEQSRDRLEAKKSVLKNLCPEGDYVNFQGQFVHVRSYLDRFLFFGNRAELPVEKLSGGEKARLRLAQLMLEPAQVLILDEPTNDLDMETLEVLEGALSGFPGAVILVTHDRYFMDAVCDKILAFPRAEYGLKNLVPFSSYFQWEEWSTQMEDKTEPNATTQPTTTPPTTAPKVKVSFKERHEFEQMEKVVMELEQKILDLKAQCEDPKILADHIRMTKVTQELALAEAELEKKFERWQELEAKLGTSSS